MEISRLTTVPAICKCRGCSCTRIKYDSAERQRGSTFFRRDVDASISRPRRRWRPKAARPHPEMVSRCATCPTPNVNLRRERLNACGSLSLSGPQGRNLRPWTLGGIPGIRECTMPTVVPCSSLRHGICSVGCRQLQIGQLSTDSAPTCSAFDVNQLNRPSLLAEDLVVLDQVPHLPGIDGHA